VQNRAQNVVTSSYGEDSLPIVAHSHLRWDFVWQRPQQILGRLAQNHRVAFIEEPLFHAEGTRLEISEAAPNVVRIVPRLPHGAAGDTDGQCAQILPHLERAFREHPLLARRFERVIHWFYSPSVAPSFLGKFDAAAIVYDCMDELSMFRYAPRDLAQREAALLAAADVVFTGGYQLYVRKSSLHGNVHFYGCGVDADHFAKAQHAETRVPPDIAALPRPLLGYFGVVDERLDYELIAQLAARFSQGSVVMIGPVAKVDPATLPRAGNLYWLGQRPYADLPAYVKGFDVCLMPFALNDATQNINPTKTLEYMAAGKPVVSTGIADVVRHFTPIVEVAGSRAEFIDLALRASVAPDATSIRLGMERARMATWEMIVEAMREHMLSAVRSRHAARPSAVTAKERAA
jgi:glycosyltransferase involved in cell wall biosynthesis